MNNKERDLKRISLFIGEDQYNMINEKGLNLSWLVRDLIDDYLGEKKIVLNVSDESLEIYQKIVGNIGALDSEFEPYFKEALRNFLKSKIEIMQNLEKTSFKKQEGSKK